MHLTHGIMMVDRFICQTGPPAGTCAVHVAVSSMATGKAIAVIDWRPTLVVLKLCSPDVMQQTRVNVDDRHSAARWQKYLDNETTFSRFLQS